MERIGRWSIGKIDPNGNSPGLWPTGVLRSTYTNWSPISLIIGVSLSHLPRGTRGRRSRSELSRPWTLQGPIFIDFLTSQSDIEKSMFFRTIKNQAKWPNKAPLERQGVDFWAKSITFGHPFGIDFPTFWHPPFCIVFSSLFPSFRHPWFCKNLILT